MRFLTKQISCLLLSAAVLSSMGSADGLPPKKSPSETPQQSLKLSSIKRTIRKLRPLHAELGDPESGDWLDSHKERGQTFSQYLRIRPNVLTRQRSKLYIQPIGSFSQRQQELIQFITEYLSIYFNCPVMLLETKDESGIPESAQRDDPTLGTHQLLTSHLLERVLAPNLPADAFALIAFTSSDLWPGDGWNFVFGYATYRDRVGVWSLNRLGDPDSSQSAFTRCLTRTIRIATHEGGHMFFLRHCIAYPCNMQGSNTLAESDRQPIALCPQCYAKVLFATGANPIDRYARLIQFCETHNLGDQANFFKRSKAALEK